MIDTVKFYLRRIRINSQGYDATGCYWGIGAPLYHVMTDDDGYNFNFRAADREAAKDHVRDYCEKRGCIVRFFR